MSFSKAFPMLDRAPVKEDGGAFERFGFAEFQFAHFFRFFHRRTSQYRGEGFGHVLGDAVVDEHAGAFGLDLAFFDPLGEGGDLLFDGFAHFVESGDGAAVEVGLSGEGLLVHFADHELGGLGASFLDVFGGWAAAWRVMARHHQGREGEQ